MYNIRLLYTAYRCECIARANGDTLAYAYYEPPIKLCCLYLHLYIYDYIEWVHIHEAYTIWRINAQSRALAHNLLGYDTTRHDTTAKLYNNAEYWVLEAATLLLPLLRKLGKGTDRIFIRRSERTLAIGDSSEGVPSHVKVDGDGPTTPHQTPPTYRVVWDRCEHYARLQTAVAKSTLSAEFWWRISRYDTIRYDRSVQKYTFGRGCIEHGFVFSPASVYDRYDRTEQNRTEENGGGIRTSFTRLTARRSG